MEGRFIKYLLVLLLINDFIEAVAKIDYDGRAKNLNKFKNKRSRPLEVGDTITPEDLLEVTRRLLKRVAKPGKGIISSAKSEFDLADKLFERYFLTWKRIVIIKACDIDGLDAIQALSLDGEVVNSLRSSLESYTEAPSAAFHGFKTDPAIKLYGYATDDYPNKCHYKVLKKWVEEPATKNGTNKAERRKAVNLKNKLGKNRKLVVNPSRKELDKKKLVKDKHKQHSRNMGQMARKNKKKSKNTAQSQAHKTSMNKSTKTTNVKKSQRTSNQTQISTSNANTTGNGITCRWKYRCESDFHLQTCRLHPICSNQTEYRLSFSEEEPNENLRKFREIVGITPLDEKVEKIIESHVLKTRPENEKRDQKVEDLIQYFNKIVEAEGINTTPMTNHRNPVLVPHPLNAKVEDIIDTPDRMMAEDDLEARRILGLIPNKKKYKLFTTPKNKRLIP